MYYFQIFDTSTFRYRELENIVSISQVKIAAQV